MKIKIKQYLNRCHSWSYCGRSLARAAKRANHEVDVFSTDGIDTFPEDLKDNLYGYLDDHKKIHSLRKHHDQYDLQISYTAPINFANYLCDGKNNKFGIWAFEFPLLPKGFGKQHYATNRILPPSNFAKEGFIKAGVPEDKLTVVPHGHDLLSNVEKENIIPFPIKSKKSFKILLLIGQPHLRKGIEESFEAYMQAFTKKDDVVLLAKIQLPKGKPQGHEVDVVKILTRLKLKYPQHAEIEMIHQYVEDVASLYKIADCCFSMTHCEAFYMPGLEALQWGCVPVVGAYGGLLDFLHSNNSVLLPGKEVKADLNAQYWTPDIRNSWFKVSMDAAVESLKELYLNYEYIKAKLTPGMEGTAQLYTWDNAFKQIEDLCR